MRESCLDVGCGNTPHGTVNVDLYIEKTPDRLDGSILDPGKIKNLVRADCCHLPFPDCSFKTVCCFHVIEHIKNPLKLIRELYRVAESHIVVKCPHRYSIADRTKANKKVHIHYFGVNWFVKALEYLSIKCYKINVSKTSLFGPYIQVLFYPHEITLEIQK
jgi:SAM-dependent methyltransferase